MLVINFYFKAQLQSFYFWLYRPLRRLSYYFQGLIQLYLVPKFFLNMRVNRFKKILSDPIVRQSIQKRLSYYAKIDHSFELCLKTSIQNNQVSLKKMASSYFIDFKNLLHFFPNHLRSHFLMGDQRNIPQNISFIKSRPIRPGKENQHAILLKLNQIRHYFLIHDCLPYLQKKDMVVWRGGCFNEQRNFFLKNFFKNSHFNIGQSNRKKASFFKPFLSIGQQLTYKFIISLEGNDVATNLKWILASSSLCMMPKPRYETWFMEGTLKANFHYVEIADDFSDLEEKRQYYLAHPNEALAIIAHANQHVSQFRNANHEDCLSYLVAEKYFYHSGQYNKAIFKNLY